MQQDKRKRIINIVANAVLTVVMIIVFAVSINVLVNAKKGYIPFFGTAYVTVVTDSMEGSNADSFKKGDLLAIKVLSDKEKQNLEVGDIITFYDKRIPVERGNTPALNSHRIIEIIYGKDAAGNNIDFKASFKTQGDNETQADEELRNVSHVVGKYAGKASGFGKFFQWTQSDVGFIICVVFPAVLVLIYCIYLVVRYVMSMRGAKSKDNEKELMRREVLREMGIDPDSAEGQKMLNAALSQDTAGGAETAQGTAQETDSSDAGGGDGVEKP